MAHHAPARPQSREGLAWIFDSDFSLPQRLCILAPGPLGRHHYHEIPDGFGVLAVNKAVMIPDVQIDYWLVNLYDQAWFEQANAAYDGVRILWREDIDSARHTPSVEERLKAAYGPNTYYFFIDYPGLDDETMPHFALKDLEQTIMSGGTVTGAALQLAYHFGVREVVLCGADMSGDAYWDGSLSERGGHGAVWNSTRAVDFLIKEVLEKNGTCVSTLSPTRLDVPRWTGRR